MNTGSLIASPINSNKDETDLKSSQCLQQQKDKQKEDTKLQHGGWSSLSLKQWRQMLTGDRSWLGCNHKHHFPVSLGSRTGKEKSLSVDNY